MSIKFAKLYPENISKIILLSPIGIPKEPENFKKSKTFGKGFKNMLWNSHMNPVSIARAANSIGRIDQELTKYISERTLIRSDTEKELFKDFMK
jgi:hypothetical protein